MNRRHLIKLATAAVTSSYLGRAAGSNVSRIRRLIRREETTLRLGGDGRGFAMTWGADDRQLVAICDGAGWPEDSSKHYSTRLFVVGGPAQQAAFTDVRNYPDVLQWDLLKGLQDGDRSTVAPYFGTSLLAVDGSIYQWLSTAEATAIGNGSWQWIGAKLIYSPDNGRNWRNQDGSGPVILESWKGRSRENMMFFNEPQQAFAMPSFIQMGRDYRDNQDGYVYVHAANGRVDGRQNELVMFRVPKARIRDRSAYEYFAGLQPGGDARWTRDIGARRIVHAFPADWNSGWPPSLVYNAPLGLYLMVSAGSGRSAGDAGRLGFWISVHPWGPWRQIHEEEPWAPTGNHAARAISPQLAPKWISADGKSLWLVWSDIELTDAMAADPQDMLSARDEEEFAQLRRQWRQGHRYYAFNTQRIDLVIE